jgi:hypothetical protein
MESPNSKTRQPGEYSVLVFATSSVLLSASSRSVATGTLCTEGSDSSAVVRRLCQFSPFDPLSLTKSWVPTEYLAATLLDAATVEMERKRVYGVLVFSHCQVRST